MKRKGDRRKFRKVLKEFLKSVRTWVVPTNNYDLTLEEFMKLESRKTITHTHIRGFDE